MPLETKRSVSARSTAEIRSARMLTVPRTACHDEGVDFAGTFTIL